MCSPVKQTSRVLYCSYGNERVSFSPKSTFIVDQWWVKLTRRTTILSFLRMENISHILTQDIFGRLTFVMKFTGYCVSATGSQVKHHLQKNIKSHHDFVPHSLVLGVSKEGYSKHVSAQCIKEETNL